MLTLLETLYKIWPDKNRAWFDKNHIHHATGTICWRLCIEGAAYMHYANKYLEKGLNQYILSKTSEYIIFIVPVKESDKDRVLMYLSSGYDGLSKNKGKIGSDN